MLGLIDFYHAAKQLSDAVKLRRWSATQRTRWLNRTRGLLKRARVDEVITALRELCRGRTAGKIRTHLNYFLKNRHRFAYTTMVGLGLPRGSGAVESASVASSISASRAHPSIGYRRASTRFFSCGLSISPGRWNCLQRMAMTPVGGAHSRFPGTVCRQRWTVRLGEVEPVFGQTGRVVLDITARTAHDGALKWTRAPSTPRAARSIFATFPSTCALPSGGRWSLRRVLERPGRQRKREQCEEQLRAIADEFFGALLTPVLQRAVRSAAVGDAASALVRHLPRRMRSDGLETVNVRTSRGTTVPVTTPYYRENTPVGRSGGRGLYPALVVLGIYDRCTPKLASDASRAVAMLSSLAEAQAQLRSDGIALDIKTLRSTAYRYAARARAAQQSAACGLLDRVTGKRVVVSLDGGRVRVRRKKRGPKTKKGRNRFHTDWKEPKLLILYVVGDDGRPSQTWAPSIDGTLRGPEAVFALLLSYARGRSASTPLTRCSSSPTARPGSGDASSASSPRSALADTGAGADRLLSCREATLGRGQAAPLERDATHPLAQPHAGAAQASTGGRGDHCPAGAVPRRTAGKIRTHLNYFLKNRHRFAYTTMAGSGFRGAAVPSKAPSVASSISASRAHPSIGYRRASTRFFSCGLSISPADGTVCSGWP